MNPAIGRTGGFLHRIAVVCIAVVLVAAGYGDDDADQADSGTTSDTAGSQVTGSTGPGADGDDSGGEAVGGSSGEATGPERDEMRDTIAAWYLAEDFADSQAEADCIADAMLDAASIDERAELGVTIDTIDELSSGPLRNDDEFLVSVTQWVG